MVSERYPLLCVQSSHSADGEAPYRRPELRALLTVAGNMGASGQRSSVRACTHTHGRANLYVLRTTNIAEVSYGREDRLDE